MGSSLATSGSAFPPPERSSNVALPCGPLRDNSLPPTSLCRFTRSPIHRTHLKKIPFFLRELKPTIWCVICGFMDSSFAAFEPMSERELVRRLCHASGPFDFFRCGQVIGFQTCYNYEGWCLRIQHVVDSQFFSCSSWYLSPPPNLHRAFARWKHSARIPTATCANFS